MLSVCTRSYVHSLQAANSSEERYRGVLDAVARIVAKEGWPALFQGMKVRVLGAGEAESMCSGTAIFMPHLLHLHFPRPPPLYPQAKMLQTVLGAALLMSVKQQIVNSTKAMAAAAAARRRQQLLVVIAATAASLPVR
jgi:hypothetical protein